MKIGCLKRVSAGAALGMIAAAGSANGQSASLVGVEDFRIANVGEGVGGFLPEVTRRNADEGRFQVNGSNPDQNNRVFGLWATFDLDFENLPVLGTARFEVEGQTVEIDAAVGERRSLPGSADHGPRHR